MCMHNITRFNMCCLGLRCPPAEVIFLSSSCSRGRRGRSSEDGLDGVRAGECSLLSVVPSRWVLQAGQQGAKGAPYGAAQRCRRLVADMVAALGRLQPWVTALQGPWLQSFSAAVRMASLVSTSVLQPASAEEAVVEVAEEVAEVEATAPA